MSIGSNETQEILTDITPPDPLEDAMLWSQIFAGIVKISDALDALSERNTDNDLSLLMAVGGHLASIEQAANAVRQMEYRMLRLDAQNAAVPELLPEGVISMSEFRQRNAKDSL